MSSINNVAFDIPSSPPPSTTISEQELPQSQPQLSSRLTPPPSAPSARRTRKARADPSVTPRKFRKFFAPRSTSTTSQHNSAERHALYDITGNRQDVAQSSPFLPEPGLPTTEGNAQDIDSQDFPRDLKRRKLLHSTESSPGNKSGRQGRDSATENTLPDHPYTRAKYFRDNPTASVYAQPLVTISSAHPYTRAPAIPSSPCERASSGKQVKVREDPVRWALPTPKPISNPLVECGLNARLLQLSFANSSRGNRQRIEYPVNDWRNETASFCSGPTGIFTCQNIAGNNLCIPFCTASLNTNSLVAIGDEEGRVSLLESAVNQKPDFNTAHVIFRVHTNAIIDMTFSEDDTRLATASGDSTARVVDMATQTTTAILGHHSASLKQVRFQTGANNNNILATSSRDGTVQIWDLRCKGSDGPECTFHAPVPPRENSPRPTNVKYGRPINTIWEAHNVSNQHAIYGATDSPSSGEAPRRAGDVSVTSIHFLPPGQEHLLLTASEADASVRLWDIRTSRRKTQIPISQTQKPKNHNKFRHFGITAMSVNTNGTRLYTVCKDNTVYAYSTAHLILGHAPELSGSTGRRLPHRDTQEGLGPIYGYRHPKLYATSFYVKSALRKAENGNSEILAVGSSDGSAMLFPLDERYLPNTLSNHPSPNEENTPDFMKGMKSLDGNKARKKPNRFDTTIPISENGTPLVRGHEKKEVGSMAWSNRGDLITVGDDYLVRVWREDEKEARDLRQCGEGEGRRWGCGWAEVNEDYDEDD